MNCFTDLSSFRAKNENASRLLDIDEHPYRSSFQRDRDRILYSKEFRRLSGKTQIFVTGSDDHMRTRLTHTLEVSQIAETISERLQLNSMLTRAIALGHDLGHTPFGHVGERTLNHIMNGCFSYYGYDKKLSDEQKGFKHNLQGVRVACNLEKSLDDSSEISLGLNLTRYTLWGIMNHSALSYKECAFCKNHKECRYKNCEKPCDGKLSVGYYNALPYKPNNETDWTLEGIIVACADEIAQRHHDIEDGIFAGIIKIENLCDQLKRIFSSYLHSTEEIQRIKDDFAKSHSISDAIQKLSKLIVDLYVTDYTESLAKNVNSISQSMNLNTKDDSWRALLFNHIANENKSIDKYFGFSQEFQKADDELSHYLSAHILDSYIAQCMDGKASFIIRQLVKAYLTNPQQLPDSTIITIIQDWNNKHSVKSNEHSSFMTDASASRKRLKELIKIDDPLISSILMRKICDHIAGMTDQYAISSFEKLYGSKGYL